jgi:hypothetical protein
MLDPEHCILNTITDQQSRNYALKYSIFLVYKKNFLRRHSVAGIISVGADHAAACFLTNIAFVYLCFLRHTEYFLFLASLILLAGIRLLASFPLLMAMLSWTTPSTTVPVASVVLLLSTQQIFAGFW